ncbi:uncharacterized protein B0I36DRAFT_434335 [Microdochium trichocladiopsis]|uniref:Uncharacterized protein n=1 Tax=Microdochium trichocladiopsis TaxID=1682393 RepID=A0A9P8XXK2_9PEZI|nr:uncharacterized protein B0I36DRAFT_434335 [Microdochium trichocladiopsis]KAH7024678.1 hypothetical protein B0I36DRAFT_434335 [Microdochium trichocladiopsis]
MRNRSLITSITSITRYLPSPSYTASQFYSKKPFQPSNQPTTTMVAIKSLALPLLSLSSAANALWLCTANVDYTTSIRGSKYESPYCQVGKGDNRDQAWSQAKDRGLKAVAIIAGGHCDQLQYKHTNQLGGFWDDYGTINYIDSNWHWYCSTGSREGCCDGGNGAPRKRSVEFEA